MGISHVFTSPIADGTNTQLVRPTDWNSSHAYTLQDAVSLSGNTAGVLANISSGTLYLAGGNNITLSQQGNSVTLSGPNVGGAQTGISGISASNTLYTSGTVLFTGSNMITVKSSGAGQTVILDATQSAQTGISGIQVSDNTFTSGTVSFRNANGISFGSSGANGVSASYTVPTLTNSSMTVSDAATSGTLARLAFTNLNGVTLSLSTGAGGSHTIVGSHNGLTSQSTDFNAITLGGNTAGTTTFHATNNRTIFLHGGNNVTLSGNGSSITISAAAQSVQTQNLVALIVSGANGNATFTSGTVSVKVGAEVTLSTGANVFSIYGNATAAQTNQTLGLYASSNTTGQSSSTTVDARSLSVRGMGIASVGYSAGELIVSVPSGGGAGDGGNTIAAGTRTASSSASVLFSDANGVSFGLNAVNGTVLTASVAAQTNQTGGVYAVSNTYGTSSGTYDARTLSIEANGILSVAASNSGWEMSAPAIMSRWWNTNAVAAFATLQANSSVSVVPVQVQWPLAVSILRVPVWVNVQTTTNNSSAYLDLTCSAVLYSRNVSTLSSILSGSVGLTHTRTSNATGSVTGPQWVQLTFNQTTLPPDLYFWAIHVSTTNTATGGAATTALNNSISMIGSVGASNAMGVRVWAAATNDTQGILGHGIISTGATRATMGLNQITCTGISGVLAALHLDMALATVY